MKSFVWVLFLVLQFTPSDPLRAQEKQNADILAYVEAFRETAILEMQRSGVPASIKLAQGILETQAGKSPLVQRSNNHFGIKCKTTWTGDKVYHDDDARGECFRKYADAADSYRDHSDFLRTQPRYAFLFDLDPMDYKAWAYGLKKAGYATLPTYPEKLIGYIETYRLDEISFSAIKTIDVRANGITHPAQAVPEPTSTAPPSSDSIQLHKVQPGETLYTLSRRYGIGVALIREWNNLAGDALRSGQELRIPKKM